MSTVNVQPQVTQLELTFKKPLVKDSEVERLSDLLTLKNNYLHKRVWVKELELEYYLASFDDDTFNGSDISHWKPVTTKTSIPEWDVNKKYMLGDIVVVKKSGKLYRALVDDLIGKNPINFPFSWQPITGDIETTSYNFYDQSEVIIAVDIADPMFRVFEIEDVDGVLKEYEISCIIDEISADEVEVNNLEDLVIRKDYASDESETDMLETLPDAENFFVSRYYRLSFFENNLPKVMSGRIIVK